MQLISEEINTSRANSKNESNKENMNPNIPANSNQNNQEESVSKEKKFKNGKKMIIDEIGTDFLKKHKIKSLLSKNSTTIFYSKQSKVSGISTRDEENQKHAFLPKDPSLKGITVHHQNNDCKSKHSNPSRDRENPIKLSKANKANLKIVVPNHDRIDFNTIKSTQLSMKSKQGDLVSMSKITKREKVGGGATNPKKKKFNI